MSVTPLAAHRADSPADTAARRAAPRTMAAGTARSMPTSGGIARRRAAVNVAKRVLPLGALALLATLALWPEIQREASQAARAAFGNRSVVAAGQLLEAQYNGVDVHARPYAMTAASARQVSPERIDLTDIKADLGGGAPGWVMVEGREGVYGQHTSQLDLSGDVKLYRDDGTTLWTDAAAVELKQGAAAGSDRVHAEGPFGTLDAQGFALTDRGGVIQFTGPGHLVLNSRAP